MYLYCFIQEETLYDPIKLMILIYLCEDDNIPQNFINRCRLNPNVGIDTYRTDLEFYVGSLYYYVDSPAMQLFGFS